MTNEVIGKMIGKIMDLIVNDIKLDRKYKIITSTNGKNHLTELIDNKIYYKCIKAVGSHKFTKLKLGKVTCKNCLRSTAIKRKEEK